MIKDRLENAELYYNLSDRIKEGFLWLKKQDFDNLKTGRYYINSDEIYANVDEYETKQDADYEAHRKYIDIQFMINGEEYIAVTDISNCVQSIDYNEEKDIAFYKADNSFQTLKSGEFLILYPHDAHKPCISINNARHCKKVVVKILI